MAERGTSPQGEQRWPNLGYGRFGAKVTMGNAPVFESPDLFDPRRIHLADIDGSGNFDIIYVGHDGVWRLSPPHIFTRKFRTPCYFGRRSFSRDRSAQRSGTCWTNRTITAGWRSAATSPQPFSQRSLLLSSSSSRSGRVCIRALAGRRRKASRYMKNAHVLKRCHH